DGWVYCAAGAHHGGYNKGTQIECKLTGEKIDLGSRDFRFKPDTGEFDPQTGPSQFGRARDDWGHWFGVQNSFPLWHYVLQDHYLRRNPHVIPPDPIHQLFPRNPPVYPASSMEKRFHSFDQAGRFTSACGIEVYRDQVLFNDGKTHAFTCEPFHNVVQHHILEDDGVTFKAVPDSSHLAPRDEQTASKSGKASKQENAPLISTERDGHSAVAFHDFLASEDRWCRPVMVRTGPDGALWVADMYRYMIEHPQWLPQNGKEELLPHYREGDDKGRIWRVVKSSHLAPRTDRREIASQRLPEGGSEAIANEHTASKSGKASGKGNVPFISTERDDYFASPNGWLRDKAQMRAMWGGKGVDAALSPLNHSLPQVRAQNAWTLRQAGKLTSKDLTTLLLDDHDEVVTQALEMLEGMPLTEEIIVSLIKLVSGPQFSNPRIRMQLALSAGSFEGDSWGGGIVARILGESEAGSAMSGAAMSSVLPHLKAVCEHFGQPDRQIPPGVAGMLLRCALDTKNEPAIGALLFRTRSLAVLEEVLTVLDEKNLSPTQLAQQLESHGAKQALAMISERLAQAADSIQTAPTMESLALLASDREHRERVKALLPELWAKTGNAEVLRLVAKLQPQGGEQFLLEGWDQRTPALRVQILETLLSNDAWTLALLKRPEAKSADAATRARLMKHPKKNIASLAEKVFADSTSATRAAVVEKFKPALKLQGDAARGKTVFASVCISCHKLDGVGLELGPDLRSVAQHDADKLLNSILDPSAIIEPGFMAYHCTLKSGEQLYGVIATETSASLTLKMAGNVTKSVLRIDVASLKSAGTSLMPEGLEAAMTPQSLADLIAYLKVAR
ncbi:MAG: c-type cytochrome, partial [Verrucomicrobia bacterium]|nr:c-type cytochrome [Verrucomicrobiota bacterium]